MSSLGEPIEGLADTPGRPQLVADVFRSQIDLRQGVPSPDLRLTLHPRRLSPERREARIDYGPPRHCAIVNLHCEQDYGQRARNPRPQPALGPVATGGVSAYDPDDGMSLRSSRVWSGAGSGAVSLPTATARKSLVPL